MKSARLLDRFPLVDTCNPDEMRAALARMYITPIVELVDRDRTFRTVINRGQLSNIDLNYASYAGNFRMEFPETEFVSQMFPIGGKAEALVGGTSVRINADRSVVISAGESLHLTINGEYERLILKVNSTALTNKLSALTGASINRPLKFNPTQDDRYLPAKALRDHFFFLVNSVSASAVPFPKLVLAEFEQTLMVMFLYANRHNYSHFLEQATPAAASWQVSRAEEYIEANAQRPLTLEELAEVTGASILGLFRAFKKKRSYSLTQFADRARLVKARELLQRPDAATTVAGVASMCGFGDFGRFANDYSEAFGEQPSQTLSRSKEQRPPSH